MKTIKAGHLYELGSFAKGNNQRIQFIERKLVDGKWEMVNDGTTNEEVLEMLIDRLSIMDAKLPCEENREILSNLTEALEWQKKRASRIAKEKAERG
jgi:hypothetical protein